MVNFYWGLYIQVELIGYAATDDELFLIYEYAQKGSLRNHLHDPQSKGKIGARLNALANNTRYLSRVISSMGHIYLT